MPFWLSTQIFFNFWSHYCLIYIKVWRRTSDLCQKTTSINNLRLTFDLVDQLTHVYNCFMSWSYSINKWSSLTSGRNNWEPKLTIKWKTYLSKDKGVASAFDSSRFGFFIGWKKWLSSHFLRKDDRRPSLSRGRSPWT